MKAGRKGLGTHKRTKILTDKNRNDETVNYDATPIFAKQNTNGLADK